MHPGRLYENLDIILLEGFFYTWYVAACFSGEMWFNWKHCANMRSEDEPQLQACQIRNPI